MVFLFLRAWEFFMYKTIILICCLLLCFFFSEKINKVHAQELVAPTLNLDPGKSIFDIEDVPVLNCYVIVGDFASVNSIPCNKIAFIDKSTLQVKSGTNYNPVQAIDGDIYQVECYVSTSLVLPITHTINLYLGGNFNNITVGGSNYSRKGIAKLTTTKLSSGPPNNYMMSTWNPQLTIGAFPGDVSGVRSMDISNDTLFYAGNFDGINNYTTNPVDARPSGVAAVKITTNTNLAMFTSYYDYVSGIDQIDWHKGKLYVGGMLNNPGGSGDFVSLMRINADGTYDETFTARGWQPTGEYPGGAGATNDFDFLNDSLIIFAYGITDDSYARNASIDTAQLFLGADYNYSESGDHVSSQATYKHFCYVARNSSYDGLSWLLPSLYEIDFTQGLATNDFYEKMDTDFENYSFHHMWVVDNLLFVSDDQLTEIGYNWETPILRSGIAVFCLEPADAKNFNVYDTTVCAGQTITYSIPTVQYADGYVWEYSGQGIDIGVTGTENLSDTINFSSANSVNIKILSNFTPGVLSVTPYSTFHGQLENNGVLVKSNTMSISIHSNPIPHINAGPDEAITCYTLDTGVDLFGYSDSAVVSYEWLQPFPDPSILGQTYTATQADDYVFKVVSPLGCANYDTVTVYMDTLKPTLILPAPPYELTCAVTSLSLNGSSITPNTTIEWMRMVDSVMFADPVVVDEVGGYMCQVTDLLNGCVSESALLVTNNFIIPQIALTGYSSIPSSTPLDTLTCANDTLNLSAYSATPNSTVEHTNADTSLFFGSAMEITQAGTYYLFATESTTGCTNSQSFIISQFQNIPDAHAPADSALNCSVAQIVLDGASLSSGAVLTWSDASTNLGADPITINQPGWYYLDSYNPENGCIGTDSVFIDLTNEILVSAGQDLLICNEEIVVVTASHTGSLTGAAYSWNNGTDGQTTNFIGGIDTMAIVFVTADGGCTGTDTARISIPPDPEILFEGFKPCGNNPNGQIVGNPLSGLSPFEYSINGGISYQASPVFTNLSEGNYTILVHDSLQCNYTFLAAIDESSSLPTPSFLFSTYNYETDTVVIVDVSMPPTDSTKWNFPPGVVLMNSDPHNPMILLPDTGTFVITMLAYYGDCLVESSKTIYASPFDSLAATQYNLNGIKSIELYPNPTTGNFTVTVEFYQSQRAAVVVQDMLGNTYFFEEYDESLQIVQDVFLDLSVLDGTYVLKVISEYDSGSVTFILAR